MSSTLDAISRGQKWEYLVITVSPDESLGDARRRLVEHAEYGRWEHARTRLYMGGGKKVWMRRRIIRVQSTL